MVPRQLRADRDILAGRRDEVVVAGQAVGRRREHRRCRLARPVRPAPARRGACLASARSVTNSDGAHPERRRPVRACRVIPLISRTRRSRRRTSPRAGRRAPAPAGPARWVSGSRTPAATITCWSFDSVTCTCGHDIPLRRAALRPGPQHLDLGRPRAAEAAVLREGRSRSPVRRYTSLAPRAESDGNSTPPCICRTTLRGRICPHIANGSKTV